jgi:hypothetical protein
MEGKEIAAPGISGQAVSALRISTLTPRARAGDGSVRGTRVRVDRGDDAATIALRPNAAFRPE